MHRENVYDNFSFLSQSPKSSVRQHPKETCQSNFGVSIKISNSLHLFSGEEKLVLEIRKVACDTISNLPWTLIIACKSFETLSNHCPGLDSKRDDNFARPSRIEITPSQFSPENKFLSNFLNWKQYFRFCPRSHFTLLYFASEMNHSSKLIKPGCQGPTGPNFQKSTPITFLHIYLKRQVLHFNGGIALTNFARYEKSVS